MIPGTAEPVQAANHHGFRVRLVIEVVRVGHRKDVYKEQEPNQIVPAG
jgi:hypothetical protein